VKLCNTTLDHENHIFLPVWALFDSYYGLIQVSRG